MKKTAKDRARRFTNYLIENNINTKKVRHYIAQWCKKPFSKEAIRYMIYGLDMANTNPQIFKN